MRVILVNKFYYHRGGDCIYTIELEKLLKSKDHEVAVFSMQHPFNKISEYSVYFPSHIDFNKRSLKSLFSLMIRPFGSYEVRRKFTRLIHDFKPDIIHLNNIHSQLSPVIAQIGKKHNIPVLWTLHDYKLVCPAYLLLNRGKPCEECLDKRWSVVTKRCIKDNFIASLIAYCEARYWNSGKLSKITDIFISPSNFLKVKMVKGGFNPSKIEILHNFVRLYGSPAQMNGQKDYYCYIGRISSEKGIETLLKAAEGLPEYKLKIVGSGPLEKVLSSRNRSENIEFVGFKTGEELKSILSGSRFMVVPSEVFENNPLTVLEALCLGIPVLGSDIGGIPELIIPDFNGMLFERGNVKDMAEKIKYLWNNFIYFKQDEIIEDAQLRFNSENFYNKLLKLYKTVTKNRK